MRTFALIPAAGQSRRMGQPKLLLPLGDRTVLEHVLAALRSGGCAEMLVVVGPDGAALQQVAERAGSSVLRLAEATPDMRSTCLRGLEYLEERWQPQATDGWLLVPADHPTLSARVVGAVLAAAQRTPDTSIIVPTYRGRRGHPVWIRWDAVAEIRQLPAGRGLNDFVRRQKGATLELEWDDAEILRDVDTPEDYQRLLRDL
jgi:molybdenum cofactor cytidylyltransferase